MATHVRNAVLNFMYRSMQTGNKIEQIVKRAVEFFSHTDILNAKEKLISIGSELGYDYVFRKTANDNDNIIEMAKILSQCAKDNKSLPQFVIVDPQEVPTCPDEISACIRVKVNEMCRRVDVGLDSIAGKIKLATDTFSEQLSKVSEQCVAISDTMSLAPPSLEPQVTQQKPLYSVVVKNMPPDLNSPQARQEFISKLCPSGVDSDSLTLKRSNNDWKILVKSCDSATQLAQAMSSKQIDTQVRVPQFVGIVKRIPSSLDENELSRVAGCEKAVQCGDTRAFKLYYPSRADLENAIANPLKICLELFRVEEFRFLPRRCFKCHSVGHIAANCNQQEKCSHCGGTDHMSSRVSPCKKPQMCLNCSSKKHNCYHASCPFNQAQPSMPPVS